MQMVELDIILNKIYLDFYKHTHIRIFIIYMKIYIELY